MVRLGSVLQFQSFLRRNLLRFACAESCTGGLVARTMTSPAGASDVFWGGVVTYANEAKVSLLKVPEDLIQRVGAVSAEVAQAMVLGLVRVSGVALGVSITGVAGPSGGTFEKPVGTVWFGLAATRNGLGRVVAVRHRFLGSRSRIQKEAARWARGLAQAWWEAEMELDSLRSVIDNENKPFIEAFQPPISFFPNPL